MLGAARQHAITGVNADPTNVAIWRHKPQFVKQQKCGLLKVVNRQQMSHKSDFVTNYKDGAFGFHFMLLLHGTFTLVGA